jgi:TRAP-type C4-dicarboxylate transport system permease small subunit
MKVVNWLNKSLEKTLICILLLAMVFCITAQLILRWTGQNLSWTEEIARYCFVWLIWVASAEAVKLRKHIKVEILFVVIKKEHIKTLISIIANILFMVFCVVMAYFEVILLYKVGFVQHQVAPATQIPMALPEASVAVGLILMLIRLVQDTVLLIHEYKDKKKEVEA